MSIVLETVESGEEARMTLILIYTLKPKCLLRDRTVRSGRGSMLESILISLVRRTPIGRQYTKHVVYSSPTMKTIY